MRPIILLTALAAAPLLRAQQINAYRYWFDDNAASAVTTSVTPGAGLVLNTELPTGSMAPGFHHATIQVRDSDGKWSVPQTSVFLRGGSAINGYRYWLNDDPATLVNAALTPSTTVDMNAMLATATTRHFNLVSVQFKDSEDQFSVPYTKAYTRGTGAVDGYEYWIDDAVADRVSNAIGPNSVVDLIADLPVPAEAGEHLFTIRFRSENGNWSVPLSSTYTFVVGVEELTGVSDLLLFPNPATDQLGIRLNSTRDHLLRVEVLDMQGRVVLDHGNWTVHGSAWGNWDIHALASGSYMLRLTGTDGAHSTRFVKQ